MTNSPNASTPSFRFVATIITLSVSAVLLIKAWAVLQIDVVVEGDFACDEMMMERARHGALFVGHYSRFGFYHPGPFFFYFRVIVAELSAFLFPGPFEAHTAAILILNGMFIGLAGAAAHGLSRSSERGRGDLGAWLSALGIAAVVFFQFHDSPTGIMHSWMPDVVRMPYFAFLLLVQLAALGSPSALIAATFSAAACVHGYVSMPLFVGPLWIWALALNIKARIRADSRWPFQALMACALVIVLFIAPMIVDAIVNPPGNTYAILAFMRQPHDHNGWSETIEYVLRRWKVIHPALWLVPGIALAIDSRRGCWRHWLPPIAIAGFVSVVFVAYIWSAPGDIVEYIGYFYESVPLMLIGFGAIRLASCVAVQRRMVIATAAALMVAAIVMGGGTMAYRGFNDLRQTASDIAGATYPNSAITLDISEHKVWPMQMALIFELGRHGYFACAPNGARFGISDHICKPEASAWPAFRVIPREECAGRCFSVNDSTGIIRER